MNRWRGAWAAAQLTGVIFSSLVWIVVCGLSVPALVVAAAIGITLVIGRNARPMLWRRFGATPANDFHRDTTLTAIVPIASLRGRHQPRSGSAAGSSAPKSSCPPGLSWWSVRSSSDGSPVGS